MIILPPSSGSLLLPRDLANNVWWYDGNDPIGNGSIVTSNTALSSFADKSPLSLPVTQATGAAQPIWKPNLYNGKSAVSFNGSQYMLHNFSSGVNPSAITIMMVFAQTGNAGVYGTPLSSRDSTAATKGFNFYTSSANNLEFWVGNNGTVNWQTVTANAITLNTLYLVTAYAAVSSNPVTVNGVTYSGTTAAYTVNASGAFGLGALRDGSNRFTGNICETAAWGRILSAWEQQAMALSWAVKWAGGIS